MIAVRFFKTVRTHWKKSIFAVGAVSYGVSEAKTKFDVTNTMRVYCKEAAVYGDEAQNLLVPNKKMVVILNPAANKKSAEKKFRKYCEPILHLGGYLVEVVPTDSEGHAKRYVEEMTQLPDALLVAGGDGTVSEVVTGLMRRSDGEKCPVGILPVGRENSTAARYFNLPAYPNDFEEAQGLAKTAIAVLRGTIEPKNILQVQPLTEGDDQTSQKPIYALNSLQWGAYRDVKSLQDRYWYVGPLRSYAALIFNAFSSKLNWECKAQLVYTPPCQGCRNCYIKKDEKVLPRRWWSRFVPTFKINQKTASVDYSNVTNDQCTKEFTSDVNGTEVVLSTVPAENATPARLVLKYQTPIESSFEFISKNWNRIKSDQEFEIETPEAIESRTVVLLPDKELPTEGKFFYIDNEEYELRPIKISLLPRAIDMYTTL